MATSIEEVKEYWNRRPCNIRHSPKPVGSREYFDEVEKRRYLGSPHVLPFVQFDRWRGKKVLEIGCGLGIDSVNFARQGASVTAVDLSEKSVELARQCASIYGVRDRIQFHAGDAEGLSGFVPPEPYDLIYSFGAIHHTPHPERVLSQLHHFVHRGSTIKLMLYHARSWKVLWILLTYGKGQFWKASELVARHSEAQTGCPVTHTYSCRTAKALLASQGFRIQELRVEHIFPYRISDYIQYRYVKEWYWRCLPASIFRWLELHLGWHLCITAIPEEDQPT